MTEATSVLDRDMLRRAAENLEAEAQLCMARAKLWSKGAGQPPRRNGDEKAGDEMAYERWAELHRAAKSLLAISAKVTR